MPAATTAIRCLEVSGAERLSAPAVMSRCQGAAWCLGRFGTHSSAGLAAATVVGLFATDPAK
jgi:hypothetical protein